MADTCYNCGTEITEGNKATEHIPAQNLYAGFPPDYKENRLTVPACFNCNNGFSHLDDEIRNIIGLSNDDLTKENQLTQKAVRSIIRRSNWKDRIYTDMEGNVRAVDFSYDDVKTLHVKHFKGLFYHIYKLPIPDNYQIEIIADGDEELTTHATEFYKLLTSQNEHWQKSGHSNIFKYILKAVHLDFNTGTFIKNDDFRNATFIGAVLVYHEQLAVVVLAASKEYLAANKAQYGY